jgi:hypothetical protein
MLLRVLKKEWDSSDQALQSLWSSLQPGAAVSIVVPGKWFRVIAAEKPSTQHM